MEVRLSNLRGSYDLIVIGSGPAGLTLALRYDALTNGRTLIVESGYRTILNSEAQKLAVIEASGDISSAHSRHNQRVFGGTSIIWNGLCAVLEKRAFLNEEWPFTYDELSGWYPEAAKILSVPEEVHISPEKPFPDNPNIVYKPYYFSPPTRFHVLFDDWVTQSTTVDVLFNHTVTNINIKDDVALSVLVQRSSNKRTAPVEVFGSKIVLATGGIQNARLLQLSLPKSNDLPVGQYFCEHPHLRGYSHLILDEEKFRQLIFQTPSRLKILHAIALSSEFSNAHQLPSATFFLPPPHCHR